MTNAQTKKMYSVVYDSEGELFCQGAFETLEEAVGAAFLEATDFSESYNKSGDLFYIHPLEVYDNGSGYGFKVAFKHNSWENTHYHYYHILTYDKEVCAND